MSELSSVEIIKNYANSRSYPIEENNNVVKHAAMSTILSDKALILDLQSHDQDLYLIFFDACGSQINVNSTYCALAKKIKDEIKSDVLIYPKNTFDFLRFKKRFKTYDNYTDRSLCIYTSNSTIIKKYIDGRFVKKFIELNKKLTILEFAFEKRHFTFFPDLGESNLASLRSNNWILDTKELDLFIAKGSEILKGFK